MSENAFRVTIIKNAEQVTILDATQAPQRVRMIAVMLSRVKDVNAVIFVYSLSHPIFDGRSRTMHGAWTPAEDPSF